MKTNKLMLCVFGFMLLFTAVAPSAADAPLTFTFTTVAIWCHLGLEPNISAMWLPAS